MEIINPLLESAIDIARFIVECAPQPMTIGVSDTTCYLIYYPTHELDFKLKQGDPIRPNIHNLKENSRNG